MRARHLYVRHMRVVQSFLRDGHAVRLVGRDPPARRSGTDYDGQDRFGRRARDDRETPEAPQGSHREIPHVEETVLLAEEDARSDRPELARGPRVAPRRSAKTHTGNHVPSRDLRMRVYGRGVRLLRS